jgi:hypothetical protein
MMRQNTIINIMLILVIIAIGAVVVLSLRVYELERKHLPNFANYQINHGESGKFVVVVDNDEEGRVSYMTFRFVFREDGLLGFKGNGRVVLTPNNQDLISLEESKKFTFLDYGKHND